MAGKWLGLLKEITPQVSEVLFLFNPTTAPYAEYYLNPFKIAARSLGVGATAMPVSSSSGLEFAFAGQARDLKGGLIVMPDSFTTAHSAEIISLADRYRVPTIYPYRFFANSEAYCPMESISSTIFGAQQPIPIVFSRARGQANSRSKCR
jgi:putative ABC transport system substrate-binding protein